MEKDYDEIVERLLLTPYWVIDMLPCQVPQDGSGQFFDVERFYLQITQHQRLCRQFADVLLKLNCYHDLHVNHSNKWVKNPVPANLVTWLSDAMSHGHLCALVDDDTALITASGDDTFMTLYNPSPELLKLVEKLTTTAGLFVWQPQEDQ